MSPEMTRRRLEKLLYSVKQEKQAMATLKGVVITAILWDSIHLSNGEYVTSSAGQRLPRSSTETLGSSAGGDTGYTLYAATGKVEFSSVTSSRHRPTDR